jgi:uncharacterized membrane protein YbhN (UPF0104 family)
MGGPSLSHEPGDEVPLKSTPFAVLKWLLLAVVCTLLVIYVVRNRQEFYFLLRIRLEYLLPIVALSLLEETLAACRFYLVLTAVTHRVHFWTTFRHFVVGQFLPQGGNVYRAVMLKKTDNVDYGRFVSGMFSFKWMNVAFSSLLGIMIIAIYDPHIQIQHVTILPLLSVVLLLLVVAVPACNAIHRGLRSLDTDSFLLKPLIVITEIIGRTMSLMKSPRLLFLNGLIVWLSVCINIFVLYFFFKSIGSPRDLVTLTIYVVVLRAAKVITLTPANLGIREFLLGLLSHAGGGGMAQGISVSVMWRLTRILTVGAMSVVMLLVDEKGTPEGTMARESTE